MVFTDSFFFSAIIPETEFFLSQEESHHLGHVLRLKVGQEIMVTDGMGKLSYCRIFEIDKKGIVRLLPLNVKTVPQESPVITVAMGFLRKQNFETAAEMVAQLPVAKIQPFFSDRTQVIKDSVPGMVRRLEDKLKVALKQSKQCWLTEILKPVSFADVLKSACESSYGCLFEKCEESGLAVDFPNLAAAENIFLIIGPEGGFSEEELKEVKNKKLRIHRLGNTRLRAELAAPVAVSAILTAKGIFL